MVPFLVTNYVECFFLGNVDHSFVSFVKCLIGLQSCFLVTPNGACLGSALVTLRHRLHEYCGGGGGAGGSGHGAGAGRKGLLSQDNLTSMSL